MFDSLVEMLNTFSKLDVTTTSGFRFKKRLLEVISPMRPVGMSEKTLELTVAGLKVELSNALPDEAIELLVLPTAQILVNMYEAQRTIGFTYVDDAYLCQVGDFSIKLS